VEIITLTNILRNAVAYSFFPMNKRELKTTKKVIYKRKDILTLEWLKILNDDIEKNSRVLLKPGIRCT
jgi:hypothetical protein